MKQFGWLLAILLISFALLSVSHALQRGGNDDTADDIQSYNLTKNNIQYITKYGYSTESSTAINLLKSDSQRRPVIVRLKDAPVLKYKARFQNMSGENPGRQKIKSPGIAASISAHESKITDTHKAISSSLTEMKIPVKRKFKDAFNGFAIEATNAEIEEIKKLPDVEAVYPDKEVHAFLGSSVPFINATDVWQMQAQGTNITGVNVTVAIVDTGVDYTHPDLGNCTQSNFTTGNCTKVIGGYDFVNNDADPMDDQGHGTHVAGIVAANGTIKGVAPDAKLLAYKVLGSTGSGLESNVIAGIERAVNDSADIISISLGGDGDPDDASSQAVDNAVAAGVVVIVAAGNDGPSEQTVASPGTARQAITVGATDDPWDILQSFSSRGPVIWANGSLLKPDIVAPGYYINSTVPYSGCTYCSTTRYKQLSGTSMATPHVSGVAALLLQEHPGWNPMQVRSALLNGAKKNLFQAYKPYEQGAGRVNALASANYNATDIITPQMASLGISDSAANIWNSTVNMTLVNYNSSPVSYDLNVSANFTGITFVYPANITAAGNSNASFNFTVSVDYSLAPDAHYYGSLILNSSAKNITIPFWFLKESLQIFIEQNITIKNTDIWVKAFGDLSELDVLVNGTDITMTKRADGSWRGTHSASRNGSYFVNAVARNTLDSVVSNNASFLVDIVPPQLRLNVTPDGSSAIINLSSDEDISPAWSGELLVEEANSTITYVSASTIVAGDAYVFYVQKDTSTGVLNATYTLRYRKYNSSDGTLGTPQVAANGRDDFNSLGQEIDRDYIGYTAAYDEQPQIIKDANNTLYSVIAYDTNNVFCGVSRIALRKLNSSGIWSSRTDVYSVDHCTNNQTLCLDPSLYQNLWCAVETEILSPKAMMDKNNRIHILWHEFQNRTRIINFTGNVTTTYTQSVQNSNQTLDIYSVFYEMIDANGTILINKSPILNPTNLSSFTIYDAAIDTNDNVYVAIKNSLSLLNTTDPLNSTLQTLANITYLAIRNSTSENWSIINITDSEQSIQLVTGSDGRVHLTFSNGSSWQLRYGIFNFTSNKTDILKDVKSSTLGSNTNTMVVDSQGDINIIYSALGTDPYSWYSGWINYSRYSKAPDVWTSGTYNFEQEALSEFLLPRSQTLATPYKMAADSRDNLYAVWASDHYDPVNVVGLPGTPSLFYRTMTASPYMNVTGPDKSVKVLNVTGTGANWNSTFNCTLGGTHIIYSRIADYAGNINETKTWFSCNITVPPENTKPEAPAWVSPSNLSNTRLTGLSLNWSNASDANSDPLTYILFLDDNSDFSSPIILENLGNATKRIISDSDGLQNEVAYYFKVYANDRYQDGNQTTGNFNVSAAWCGDGTCSGTESCSSCASDCGVCPSNPIAPAVTATSSGGGGGTTETKIVTVTIRPDEDVIKVTVNLESALSNPSVTVAKVQSAPVSAPPEQVYHYLNITKVNFNNTNIENATIEFEVNKNWIIFNNITAVYLARYENGWNKLKTEQVSSTAATNKYRAYTNAFSYFAIVGDKEKQAEPAARVPKEETGAKEQVTFKASKEPEKPQIRQEQKHSYVVYLITSLVLAVALYAKKKARPGRT